MKNENTLIEITLGNLYIHAKTHIHIQLFLYQPYRTFFLSDYTTYCILDGKKSSRSQPNISVCL